MPNTGSFPISKKVAVLILKLAVTLGLLFYIFQKTPVEDVSAAFRSANLLYLFLGFVCVFMMRVLETVLIEILLRLHKIRLRFIEILEINLTTSFYGLFLPGLISGGAVRWYKFVTSTGKPAETLACMIFNRFMSLLMLVVVGVFYWGFENRGGQEARFGIYLGVLLAVLFVFYYLIFRKKGLVKIFNLLNRFQNGLIPEIIISKLKKLVDSFSYFDTLKPGEFFFFCAGHFGGHFVGIASFYAVAHSAGIDIGFISLGWIRVLVFIVTMLPISISGFGVREGALIYLLRSYGISSPEAVAYSFLLFSLRLATGAIGGVWELKNFFIKRKKTPKIFGEI